MERREERRELGLTGEKGRGRGTGQVLEVPDQVRLIEVATLGRDAGQREATDVRHQRIRDRLAWFDFTTRKFPIPFINLAGWPLREKKTAIVSLDYGGRDIHHALGHWMAIVGQNVLRKEPDVILWRPAQSRAKCHATRPLRDPRVSAHCNASLRAFAPRSRSGTPSSPSQ